MPDAPLMLSVSGLRGIVGASLTPAVAERYAAAFGQWLKTQRSTGVSPHVVLGRDSRPSGEQFAQAAAEGLASVGCRVTLLGIVTTPGVAIMAADLGADGGMVITASHNPGQWNGIKALRHDGVAPPPDQASQIIERFHSGNVEHAPAETRPPIERDDTAHQVHLGRILPHVNAEAIRAAKLRVVIDSAHGAGGPEAALLLDALGVQRIHLYEEPTGDFPHAPEPTKENLTELAAAVAQHGADVGFAQDPDADRLALVDDRGVYIGEEYTLALAVLHVLGEGTEARRHEGTKGVCDPPASLRGRGVPIICANLSTSRMIDDLAAQYGAAVVRTAVGEANVAAAMRANNALIGGEGNGGVIWPAVTFVRDSLAGMALILELLAMRKQRLSVIAATIPAYNIVKEKLPIDPALVARLPDLMQRAFPRETLDTQDGVRIDWPNRWLHVRASNTEPVLRIIAEAPGEAEARELIDAARNALGIE